MGDIRPTKLKNLLKDIFHCWRHNNNSCMSSHKSMQCIKLIAKALSIEKRYSEASFVLEELALTSGINDTFKLDNRILYLESSLFYAQSCKDVRIIHRLEERITLIKLQQKLLEVARIDPSKSSNQFYIKLADRLESCGLMSEDNLYNIAQRLWCWELNLDIMHLFRYNGPCASVVIKKLWDLLLYRTMMDRWEIAIE